MGVEWGVCVYLNNLFSKEMTIFQLKTCNIIHKAG